MKGPTGGGNLPEASGNLNRHVKYFYHGRGLKRVPQILESGFKTTFGTGSEHLYTVWNVPVPGVYVAKDFNTASGYPIAETTEPCKENKKKGVSGGTVIAEDGSFPYRVVIRMLAHDQAHLWKKTEKTSSHIFLFRPQDLHITHIILYPVHPEHQHKRYFHMQRVENELMKESWRNNIMLDNTYETQCLAANLATLQSSAEEAKKYPVQVVMMMDVSKY